MNQKVKLKLWNHWFWITVLGNLVVYGNCDSLVVEPEQNTPQQNSQEASSDPAMMVSKSVSVSKVSVKMGDVSEGRSLSENNNNFNNNYLTEVVSLPIVNPRVAQPPQSYLQHLLEQLNQIATVNVGDYDANVDDDVEYQLVYKDDYISDYELDQLSDEYLDYLYQMYDDIGNVLSFYDDTVDIVNTQEPDILEADHDQASEVFRSEMAIGRALDPQEDIAQQLDENVVAVEQADIVNNKLEYVDKFLNISKEEVKPETTETTIEDFVVELKSTNNSDVYIKIGIFITVTLAVLIMTAGLIYVMIRRRKIKTVSETSLVTNQDEAAVNNQVVFQKGLRSSTTSSLQEHFNNHFGKAAYLYDDLHSLDNDSFLTSLETISEKDRFDWE